MTETKQTILRLNKDFYKQGREAKKNWWKREIDPTFSLRFTQFFLIESNLGFNVTSVDKMFTIAPYLRTEIPV